MYSNCLSGGAERKPNASAQRISACDWNPQCSTLNLIVSMGSRFESEKRTNEAPRLKASMPTAPVPANTSHQFESTTSPAIILNNDSFTRSVMGRVVSPATDLSLRPLALPAMTLRLIRHSSLPQEDFRETRSQARHIPSPG